MKNAIMYRCIFRYPDESDYHQCYLISYTWPDAFNMMYMKHGDSIAIKSMEIVAHENVELVIDPDYVRMRQYCSNTSIDVINDIPRYDKNF